MFSSVQFEFFKTNNFSNHVDFYEIAENSMKDINNGYETQKSKATE